MFDRTLFRDFFTHDWQIVLNKYEKIIILALLFSAM